MLIHSLLFVEHRHWDTLCHQFAMGKCEFVVKPDTPWKCKLEHFLASNFKYSLGFGALESGEGEWRSEGSEEWGEVKSGRDRYGDRKLGRENELSIVHQSVQSNAHHIPIIQSHSYHSILPPTATISNPESHVPSSTAPSISSNELNLSTTTTTIKMS